MSDNVTLLQEEIKQCHAQVDNLFGSEKIGLDQWAMILDSPERMSNDVDKFLHYLRQNSEAQWEFTVDELVTLAGRSPLNSGQVYTEYDFLSKLGSGEYTRAKMLIIAVTYNMINPNKKLSLHFFQQIYNHHNRTISARELYNYDD